MSDDNSDSNRGLVKFNAWWLAAAILVLAVIAALVLVLTFGGRDNPEGGTTPSGAPSTPSAQPSEDESTPPETGGVCDLPSGSDIPTVGPDAEWVNRMGLLTPTSSEYAAASADDTLWGCFAPSPTGALFAATSFMAGLQESTDADAFRAFVEEAAVDNNGRAPFIEENASLARSPEPGRTAQISGFRFDSVEPEEVVIRVGMSQSAGSETVTAYVSFTLVWDSERDTWLVDVERITLRPTLDPLAGYTDWSASQ